MRSETLACEIYISNLADFQNGMLYMKGTEAHRSCSFELNHAQDCLDKPAKHESKVPLKARGCEENHQLIACS